MHIWVKNSYIYYVMKKYIFTFLILTVLISIISACSIKRKGGCDCPGMSQNIIENNKEQS